jgi:hypothetical protein
VNDGMALGAQCLCRSAEAKLVRSWCKVEASSKAVDLDPIAHESRWGSLSETREVGVQGSRKLQSRMAEFSSAVTEERRALCAPRTACSICVLCLKPL